MNSNEVLEVLKNNIKDMYRDMPIDDVKSEYYKAGARKAIRRVLIQIDLLKSYGKEKEEFFDDK